MKRERGGRSWSEVKKEEKKKGSRFESWGGVESESRELKEFCGMKVLCGVQMRSSPKCSVTAEEAIEIALQGRAITNRPIAMHRCLVPVPPTSPTSAGDGCVDSSVTTTLN